MPACDICNWYLLRYHLWRQPYALWICENCDKLRMQESNQGKMSSVLEGKMWGFALRILKVWYTDTEIVLWCWVKTYQLPGKQYLEAVHRKTRSVWRYILGHFASNNAVYLVIEILNMKVIRIHFLPQ